MITKDKPGLSRKTRFCDAKPGISIAKPAFSPQNQVFLSIYQVLRISALKTYPFYSKTWFCGEIPGLTEQNMVCNCKTWSCSVKPGFSTQCAFGAKDKGVFANVVQFTITGGKPNAH